MDTARRAAFIAGLRELAAFLEQHPDVDAPRHQTMNFFPRTREKMQKIARGASWDKVWLEDWFTLRKTFCDDLTLEINIERGTVCRKVKTGTTIVSAKPAEPEHEVETYQWVCDDSILSEAEEHRRFNVLTKGCVDRRTERTDRCI